MNEKVLWFFNRILSLCNISCHSFGHQFMLCTMKGLTPKLLGQQTKRVAPPMDKFKCCSTCEVRTLKCHSSMPLWLLLSFSVAGNSPRRTAHPQLRPPTMYFNVICGSFSAGCFCCWQFGGVHFMCNDFTNVLKAHSTRVTNTRKAIEVCEHRIFAETVPLTLALMKKQLHTRT